MTEISINSLKMLESIVKCNEIDILIKPVFYL
jgi:hypothetical protein